MTTPKALHTAGSPIPPWIIWNRSWRALEHGKGAVAYASGMGAVSGAIFALLKSGDHAFSPRPSIGTEDVTSDWLPRFGIAHDTFDAADLSQLEGLIKPNTKLIYVESPANPTMVLVDIAAVVEIAHKHGINVLSDNTLPRPTTPPRWIWAWMQSSTVSPSTSAATATCWRRSA